MTEECTCEWLCDYCKGCVEQFNYSRVDVITAPYEVHWPGGKSMLTGRYQCSRGHEWTCHWSPEYIDATRMGE